MNQNHVVNREFALRGSGLERKRHDAPVREADAPCLASLAARFPHHHGRRPVDIIERQARGYEGLLPRRALVGAFLFCLDPLDSLTQIRFCALEFQATSTALILKQSFHGAIKNIFDLQNQVTASVVGAIALKMERAEVERARHTPTE